MYVQAEVEATMQRKRAGLELNVAELNAVMRLRQD
jgi:hypothetical protein